MLAAMELHHKLRRDPNWHPNACNICGQLGHQAANCTNGTINWKQIYGEEAFIIRQPVYWSEIQQKKKAKEINIADLERRAKEYAKTQAQTLGMNYDEILLKAQQTMEEKEPVIKLEALKEEESLPPGWAIAHDPTGRPYYWHKKTQKTMWEKPTVETPTN